jgi:hypothetical protein
VIVVGWPKVGVPEEVTASLSVVSMRTGDPLPVKARVVPVAGVLARASVSVRGP